MSRWRVIEAERRVAYCAVALDLRDEFTGDSVLTPAAFTLEVQNGGEWIPRPIHPVRGPSGVYLFTGLGRSADPSALPQFRVRVTVTAPGYRPLYRLTDDALEFDVGSYNDQVPPAVFPIMPQQVLMLPSAGYRYAGHIRTIKGRVLDPGGDPVADAEVRADGIERVMTDASGGFTVPLRWQDPAATVAIAVQHPRSGRNGAGSFTLPADLIGNHDLTIA